MSVNIAFCDRQNTLDNRALVGASAVGDPCAPLVRVGITGGATGHSRLLFRYYGESGCRYGINDAGLFIGAVENYCKVKSLPGGKPYAEVVEGALTRCETAAGALEYITDAIGQGLATGDTLLQCGFYIADRTEAWMLETVNELWVAKRSQGYNAMSGDFFITGEYDLAGEGVSSHPKAKNGKLDFKSVFAFDRKATSSGVAIRRFLAVQRLYELINGEPSRGFINIILGREQNRRKAAGLDWLSMREVMGARSTQVRNPTENMSVNALDAVRLCTSGAAILLPDSDLVCYTPGAVPSSSLYIPVALSEAFDSDEDDSAREWLKWEFVRRSAETGSLDSEVYLAAIAETQNRLDDIAVQLPVGDAHELCEKARAAADECLSSLLGQCTKTFAELSQKGAKNRAEARAQNERLSQLASRLGLSL